MSGIRAILFKVPIVAGVMLSLFVAAVAITPVPVLMLPGNAVLNGVYLHNVPVVVCGDFNLLSNTSITLDNGFMSRLLWFRAQAALTQERACASGPQKPFTHPLWLYRARILRAHEIVELARLKAKYEGEK